MRTGKIKLKNRDWIVNSCAAIIFVCFGVNAYAGQTFYHGPIKPKESCFRWHEKTTEHFIVMYNDTYFDPEPVLKNLAAKLDFQSGIARIKIKLFIDKYASYTVVGANTIHASDERALRHELTHILFLGLNRNAPMSLTEGIAIYAEAQEHGYVPQVDIKELIAAEKDCRRVSRVSSNRSIYGMRVNRDIDRQLYFKGFYFVNNIISKKGMGAFKEFYKKCHSVENLQPAWDEVYGWR